MGVELWSEQGASHLPKELIYLYICSTILSFKTDTAEVSSY
jgi:hypothetical protein